MHDIETQRLRLLMPSSALGVAMHAYFTRNAAHFRPAMPTPSAEVFTVTHWEQRMQRMRDDFEQGRAYTFIICLKDNDPAVPIGDITFDGILRGPFQACYLGYKLDQAYVGRGIMHEALSAAISYIFRTAGLHRIMAAYRPENIRSGAVLRRLGFRIEGYACDYLCLDGAWRDHVLTALTNRSEHSQT